MERILHVLGCLDMGGAETMVMNRYRKIDRSKLQFDFIIHSDRQSGYYEEVIEKGGRVYVFPPFTGKNIFSIKKKWKNFFKEHNYYHILHSHIRSYAAIFIPIAKSYGLKTIIHSHSTSNGNGISSFAKKIFQFPLRFQADYFLACSKDAGNWLFGKKIVNSNKFLLIKNAIDVEKFIFNEQIRNRFREQLKIEDKYVFIHVGRFQIVKNHRFLLNVFKMIYELDSNVVLILIGDGPQRDEIMNLANELKIMDSIVLLGLKNNVNDYLNAADCFLFPSLWEGLGIVAIEAQASGLHTICNECLPREIKVTDLCEFISLDKPEEWVKSALNKYNRCHNSFKEIKENGYDINETTSVLTSFYKELIHEKDNFEIR